MARCTGERLMRAAGLRGLLRDKSPRTTKPAAETQQPRDLVKRHRIPRSIAAPAGLLLVLGVIGGASYLIGRRAVGQLGDLQVQAVEGVRRLRHTVAGLLPGVDEQRVDDVAAELVRGIWQALPSPYAGITSATEVLAAILLVVVLIFFFLRDGAAIWSWLVDRLPAGVSEKTDRVGRARWHTLVGYTHGVVAVAAVDAVGIGAALFLSAFIPIVVATVAGAAAGMP